MNWRNDFFRDVLQNTKTGADVVLPEQSETGASHLRSSLFKTHQVSSSDSFVSSESSNESNSIDAATTSIDSSSSSSSSSSSDTQPQTSVPDAEIVYTPTGSIDTVKTRIDFRSPKWESDFNRIREALSRAPALDEATLTAWSDSFPRFFGDHT